MKIKKTCITLCFLLCACVTFKPLEALHIAAVGDSYLAGLPYEYNDSWFKMLERDLMERCKIFSFSSNIPSGEIVPTSALADSYLNLLIENGQKPHIYIIALGINDCFQHHPYEYIYGNLESAIKICKREKIKVFLALIDMVNCYPAYQMNSVEYINNFKTIFERLHKHNPEIILFKYTSDEIFNGSALSCGDGIHPSRQGQVHIKQWIKPSIASYVKKIIRHG